jgi:hypothetical protein
MSDLGPHDYDDFDDFDNEYDEDEDDLMDECGMMPDGYCTLAGTEWCDWECPMGRAAGLYRK